MTENQDIFKEIEINPIKYGTFWERFLALFLDGIIMVPFVLADTYNKTHWKSFGILFSLFILLFIYKPFMEYKFGATVGKMALDLKVVDYEYQKASLLKIIGRNTFDIVYRIVYFIMTIINFMDSDFQYAQSLKEYNHLGSSVMFSLITAIFYSILMIAEISFLLSDSKRRSLHDRIGATFVIKK